MATNRVKQFVSSLSERQEQAPRQEPAPSGGRSKRNTPTLDLTNPEALAKIGGLEIVSQTVVDGMLSGKHRSTHKGGYTDFSHFRPYAHGDDLRLLDWRQYARSDRYYVRQYDDETNLQALIVIDASGSMRFGRSTVSKWDYARMAAACLARLLMRQRDSAGLAVIGGQGGQGVVRDFLRPMPRASHLARMIDTLSTAQAKGESGLANSLTQLVPRLTRRGMVIVLSDCFGDGKDHGVEALKQAVGQYKVRGHDVMVLQTLAPEEVSFPFKRSSHFQDLESSHRLNIMPTEIRRHYLEKFQAFQSHLTKSLADTGCDLISLSTDQDLGDGLAAFLRSRIARKSSGMRSTAKA